MSFWTLDMFVREMTVHDGGACREGLSQRVCTLEKTFKDAGPGEHVPFRPMKLITTILAAFEEQEHVYL